MKFNESKLLAVHFAQVAGFQTLRDIGQSHIGIGLDLQRLERELQHHAVVVHAAQYKKWEREFDPALVEAHADLIKKIDKLKADRAALLAEYDRLHAIQHDRGALLRACTDALKERGIKFDPPDWQSTVQTGRPDFTINQASAHGPLVTAANQGAR